jgi:phage protein D
MTTDDDLKTRAAAAWARIFGEPTRRTIAVRSMTFSLDDPEQRSIVAAMDRRSREAAERRLVEETQRALGLSARQRLLDRSRRHRAATRHVSEPRHRRAAAAHARMIARPRLTVAEPTAWYVPDELTRSPR